MTTKITTLFDSDRAEYVQEQNEKQANEEMAKVIDEYTEPLSARDIHKVDFSEKFAEDLYNAGYRKQSVGEWESFPSLGTDCRCSLCKTKTKSRTKFCPNCGAKMKGE